jgi:hypothetical protein
MSRPVADQPTRSGADGGPPAGHRPAGATRAQGDSPAAPLTVAELIARSGTGVRRRRAERRESGDGTGRQQPVGEDARPDRPPLRGGPGHDPVSPGGPVLPTGWQPAMPSQHVEQPHVEPPRVEPPARLWSPPPVPGPSAAPPPSVPARGPDVPSRPPLPALPAESPAPSYRRAPRVVPPIAVTPAAPPVGAKAAPVAPPPLPPLPGTPAAGPYPSVPVPGVRRSLPLPPIPGRDLPSADEPTTVTPLPRPPMSPGRRRLARVAVALLAVVALVIVSYVGLYFYGDRSLERVDALVPDGPEVLAPQLQESSQTYLVVGTGLPGRSGPSAVSTLIAHVSADGDRAVLVTVPPTALGDTPICRDSDGAVRPAVTEAFAAALLDGGPSCLVRSVQQLTGLRIDHYVAVDLARLPGLVGSVGDVTVCAPTGEDRLAGNEVPAYLGADDTGSDVTGATATERAQRVLTSTLHSGLTGGTLLNPLALSRFLSRAGNTLTVDADSTLGDLRVLGNALGDLRGDALQRAELPVTQVGYVPTGTDQAAVVVDATATRELFDAVIDPSRLSGSAAADDPAAESATGDPATGTGAADSLPDPAVTDPVPEGTVVTVAPAAVTLDVLDATGGGRVAEVADGLVAAGFHVGARGAEPAAVDRTVVRYGPASVEPARTVAAAVPGAVLLETDAVGGDVQLVIGPDFTGLSPVDVGTPVPTSAAPVPAEGTEAAASCR